MGHDGIRRVETYVETFWNHHKAERSDLYTDVYRNMFENQNLIAKPEISITESCNPCLVNLRYGFRGTQDVQTCFVYIVKLDLSISCDAESGSTVSSISWSNYRILLTCRHLRLSQRLCSKGLGGGRNRVRKTRSEAMGSRCEGSLWDTNHGFECNWLMMKRHTVSYIKTLPSLATRISLS